MMFGIPIDPAAPFSLLVILGLFVMFAAYAWWDERR